MLLLPDSLLTNNVTSVMRECYNVVAVEFVVPNHADLFMS